KWESVQETVYRPECDDPQNTAHNQGKTQVDIYRKHNDVVRMKTAAKVHCFSNILCATVAATKAKSDSG
ncbi:MAG TPA: hypothetical protein DCF33_11360, partial [Saprospirales bacterium]|nr:hypothetical protein [Saprospirales bacterium]